MVHVDPEIQGGHAVFRGTRLPVTIALGRLDAGESFESLHEDYPYLTLEKLKLARLYLDIFPAAPPPLNRLNQATGVWWPAGCCR
ncbi:DUF433 domain-containing protein [Pseudomonas cavernicola]|uniref:DUF433 domain-containing protein n=1 Tax=Pseudomonas cavernicola TaxID=2320866 RepID=UPI003B75CFA5